MSLFQPDRSDELVRIEGQGGKVINWNGARVLGVLAMSRAIGFLLSTSLHIKYLLDLLQFIYFSFACFDELS